MCSPCQVKAREMVTHPPVVGRDFWTTDQIRDALESWHMGRVISAYRNHPHHGRALRQEIVAGWMGITQAQLSRIENGSSVQDLHKLRQWAVILHIPAELLWFKLPHKASTGLDLVQESPGVVGGAPSASPVTDPCRAEIEDMNRRELLRLIGWACALTRHSLISVYERQFSSALPMLEAASNLAQRGDTQLPTRYWVSTVKAHAYAGLGDIASCQQSLDHAEDVHHISAPGHTTGWLRFNESRLAEERGTCLVELHRHDLAETSLTHALQQALSDRRKGSIYTDLAMVGVQRNDTDCITTYAEQALTAARHTRSGYVAKKLSSLQTHLRPLLDNGSMRQLNDQITHVVATSATA